MAWCFHCWFGNLFVVGIIILTNFKPKDLLEWNIWTGGALILAGSLIGGWLGASFTFFRKEFLQALIIARFNPDLAEGSVFFRALTAHEHAMVALALTVVFLLGLKVAKIDEETKFAKIMLYIVLLGQVIMAIACYAVWEIGKVAHLAIYTCSANTHLWYTFSQFQGFNKRFTEMELDYWKRFNVGCSCNSWSYCCY